MIQFLLPQPSSAAPPRCSKKRLNLGRPFRSAADDGCALPI